MTTDLQAKPVLSRTCPSCGGVLRVYTTVTDAPEFFYLPHDTSEECSDCFRPALHKEVKRVRPGTRVIAVMYPPFSLVSMSTELLEVTPAAVAIKPCNTAECGFGHVIVKRDNALQAHHFNQLSEVVLSSPGLHQIDNDYVIEVIWE